MVKTGGGSSYWVLIIGSDKRHNRDIFSSFSSMKVCCLSHRGDSNEYTQHIIFNIKRKSSEIIPNTIMSAAMEFLLRTQEQVRSSRGK